MVIVGLGSRLTLSIAGIWTVYVVDGVAKNSKTEILE